MQRDLTIHQVMLGAKALEQISEVPLPPNIVFRLWYVRQQFSAFVGVVRMLHQTSRQQTEEKFKSEEEHRVDMQRLNRECVTVQYTPIQSCELDRKQLAALPRTATSVVEWLMPGVHLLAQQD